MIKSVTVKNYLNETITMELTRPEKSGFIVKNIKGLGPDKATVNISEIISRDGGVFNSARKETRNIVMELQFAYDPQLKEVGLYSIEDCRHRSYQYFPLKKNITLTILTDTQELEIDGIVESNEPNIFSEEEGCQISILCPNPWFREKRKQITQTSGSEPAFEFPFHNDLVPLTLSEQILDFGYIPEGTEIYLEYDVDGMIENLGWLTDNDEKFLSLEDVGTYAKVYYKLAKISNETNKEVEVIDESLLSSLNDINYHNVGGVGYIITYQTTNTPRKHVKYQINDFMDYDNGKYHLKFTIYLETDNDNFKENGDRNLLSLNNERHIEVNIRNIKIYSYYDNKDMMIQNFNDILLPKYYINKDHNPIINNSIQTFQYLIIGKNGYATELLSNCILDDTYEDQSLIDTDINGRLILPENKYMIEFMNYNVFSLYQHIFMNFHIQSNIDEPHIQSHPTMDYGRDLVYYIDVLETTNKKAGLNGEYENENILDHFYIGSYHIKNGSNVSKLNLYFDGNIRINLSDLNLYEYQTELNKYIVIRNYLLNIFFSLSASTPNTPNTPSINIIKGKYSPLETFNYISKASENITDIKIINYIYPYQLETTIKDVNSKLTDDTLPNQIVTKDDQVYNLQASKGIEFGHIKNYMFPVKLYYNGIIDTGFIMTIEFNHSLIVDSNGSSEASIGYIVIRDPRYYNKKMVIDLDKIKELLPKCTRSYDLESGLWIEDTLSEGAKINLSLTVPIAQQGDILTIDTRRSHKGIYYQKPEWYVNDTYVDGHQSIWAGTEDNKDLSKDPSIPFEDLINYKDKKFNILSALNKDREWFEIGQGYNELQIYHTFHPDSINMEEDEKDLVHANYLDVQIENEILYEGV